MLAYALNGSMAYIVLGFMVFAILVLWDMFKYKPITASVSVAQE